MRRIRKLIESIRLYCEDGVLPEGTSLQALASEYAAICAMANQRLEHCLQFVRKGNLGEAVRQARMKPDLMLLCRLLEFDGVSYWRDIIVRGRLALPEPIDDDALKELLEACGSASLREPLMKQYRAAVQRRDDEDCIAILRQLIDVAPDDPHWREDLQRFERKRLGLMEREVLDAADRDDHSRLEELLDELQGAWTVRVKKGLKSDAVKHLDRIRREEAAVRHKELLAELAKSEEQGDAAAGRAVLEALDELHEQGLVLLDDAAATTVARVRAWVEKSEKDEARRLAFNAKLAELMRELAKDPPTKNVAPLLKSLQAMGLPLPGGVASEVRKSSARYQEIRRRRRARRRLRTVLGVVGVTCALLGVVWYGALQSRCREADEALSAAFKAGNLPAFDKALAATEHAGALFGNRVNSSSEVKGWRERRPQLAAAYDRKVDGHRQIWEQLAGVRESGFEATFETIETALAEAEVLSLGPDDAGRIDAYRAEWHAAREAALSNLLARIEDQMLADGAFSELTVSEFDERVAAIKALVSEGGTIEPVPEELRSKLADASMRLSGIERVAHGRRERLNAMTEAGSVATYIEAVSAYVEAYPRDRMATALAPLVERAPHYRRLEAVKPPANYVEASARIPFTRLVVDTFYPSVSEDNYLWKDPLARLEATHRSLDRKWPGIKAALLSLRDDRFLVSMWEYREAEDAPTKFVDVHELEKPPGRDDASVECPVYSPRSQDSSPSFRTETIKPRDAFLLRPAAHCEFLTALMTEAELLDPSEGDEFILRKIDELVGLDGVCGDFLRSSLLQFLVGQYTGLELDSAIQEPLKRAYFDLARLGERVGVSWLCRENRYIKNADADGAELVGRHFPKTGVLAAHRFARMLDVAAFGRAAGFAGTATVEGSAPSELRRPDVCEVWVLRPSGADRCAVEVVAETGDDGELSWSGALQPGEPLFAPRGTTTSRELVARLRERNGIAAGNLLNARWPAVWPANRRDANGE